MVKILILSVILLDACILTGQVPVNSSSRYSQAITYLDSNKKILEKEWLKLFPKRQYRRSYERFIDNNFSYITSTRICFLPLISYSDIIASQKIDLLHDSIELDPVIYDRKYYFGSFKSEIEILNQRSDTCGKKDFFIVTFSKPINNYLLAEITTEPRRLAECNVRFLGKTLLLLFLYDNEKLKDVYFSYVIYQ